MARKPLELTFCVNVLSWKDLFLRRESITPTFIGHRCSSRSIGHLTLLISRKSELPAKFRRLEPSKRTFRMCLPVCKDRKTWLRISSGWRNPHSRLCCGLVITSNPSESFVECFRDRKAVVVEHRTQYVHICSEQVLFGRTRRLSACDHGLQN